MRSRKLPHDRSELGRRRQRVGTRKSAAKSQMVKSIVPTALITARDRQAGHGAGEYFLVDGHKSLHAAAAAVTTNTSAP